MAENLLFESDDVYETPTLTDAGDFAALTQGGHWRLPEGPGSLEDY
ncbi:keywimysin-related RiPP [Streptomyces varsoviensis]|nr:keywimysin-related RiPP [Streptomyces varsoviensis]